MDPQAQPGDAADPRNLEENVAAVNIDLSDADFAALDKAGKEHKTS